MYLIEHNKSLFYFENFNDVIPYIKKNIKKYNYQSNNDIKIYYNEIFSINNNKSIFNCNYNEIDKYFKNLKYSNKVYSIYFYRKIKNLIINYEQNVEQININYIPIFNESESYLNETEESDTEEESEEEEETEEESEEEEETEIEETEIEETEIEETEEEETEIEETEEEETETEEEETETEEEESEEEESKTEETDEDFVNIK